VEHVEKLVEEVASPRRLPITYFAHKAANGELTISCRNRHCPKCQGSAARKWLAEREAELPPVPSNRGRRFVFCYGAKTLSPLHMTAAPCQSSRSVVRPTTWLIPPSTSHSCISSLGEWFRSEPRPSARS
jgi:hypothetical protein